MTFDEACGIQKPLDMPANERWDRYIALIGRENLRRFLPRDIKTLMGAYKTDKHFNNIPLAVWDQAAGYSGKCDQLIPHGRYVPSGLFPRLLRSKGVTCFSASECVCVLKRVAELDVLDALAAEQKGNTSC